MRNKVAEAFLEDCSSELEKIVAIVTLSEGSVCAKEVNAVRVESLSFLTKYALIKACGTIELCFKTIISERVTEKESVLVKKYLEETFLSRGINPKIKAISSHLSKFDEAWPKQFEDKIAAKDNKISSSMRYLVDERNKHAHGQDTRIGLHEVIECFGRGRNAIEILDEVVSDLPVTLS